MIHYTFGVLKKKFFSGNRFEICLQRFLKGSAVNQTCTLTFQAAISLESASGWQGYFRCGCARIKKKKVPQTDYLFLRGLSSVSNSCKCFKSKIKF